jgi:hypothetical protein
MKKEQKKYLAILFLVLLFLFVISTLVSFRRSGFFTLRWIRWPWSKPSSNVSTTTTTIPKTISPSSLINDKNYIQNKINSFLKNNPNADENYARDVVYRDIARIEKKPAICDQIKNEYLKKSCYNAVV